MARARANKTKRITLYNKILKEFTAINNKLPEDRKLSIKERRQLIKERIYPIYVGNAPSRVSKRVIGNSIVEVLNTIPPKEACDVNYISPTIYADIAWFDLDDYIKNVLPDCIFIRVDAGDFGKTKIFNTRNYNYTQKGVRNITEKLREYLNNNSGLDISFTGFKKLKRGKTNDGTPENYYIDFILVINGNPTKDIDPVIFNIPREERPKATKVKEVIINRIKELTNKKKRKKRARKSAKETINKLKRLSQIQKQSKKKETKDKYAELKMLYFEQRRKQLDKDLQQGLLTREQYVKYINDMYERVFTNLKKGGEI